MTNSTLISKYDCSTYYCNQGTCTEIKIDSAACSNLIISWPIFLCETTYFLSYKVLIVSVTLALTFLSLSFVSFSDRLE